MDLVETKEFVLEKNLNSEPVMLRARRTPGPLSKLTLSKLTV